MTFFRTILKRLSAALVLVSLPAMAMAAAFDVPKANVAPAVQSHVDLAYLIANGDVSRRNLPGLLYLIDDKAFPPPVPQARAMATLPATKAFDQFYYLGLNWVSAWALNTRDGIILFDTLTSPAEAEQYVEGGLRKLGLDPKNIKYIVITHAHPDHFGGAKYLQDKYHARVVMSDIDWNAMLAPARPWPAAIGPRPMRDMVMGDGQTLTLGGTTLTFYLTPGHTAGTLSTLIPVTDRGKPHMISFLGGSGLNQATDLAAAARTLEDSLFRFGKASIAAGADAVVSSHPFIDDAWEKAKLVQDGKARGTSPWVSGRDAVLRYYAATIEAARAIGADAALKGGKAAPKSE